jgi:hypothetical protein
MIFCLCFFCEGCTLFWPWYSSCSIPVYKLYCSWPSLHWLAISSLTIIGER